MKVDKLLTIFAFVFLTCALGVIAKTGAATGYEISIYAAYPVYFWFFLITAFALGTLILIRQAFATKESRWWLAGVAVMLLSMTILLMLPYFRGYYGYDWYDTAGTVSYTRDIEFTGHPWAGDFYPALHVLFAALSRITGVPLNTIMLVSPAVLCFLFISGIFLLTKALGLSRRASLLSLALAVTPFFGEQVVVNPRVLAFNMFPLLLYLFFRSQTVNRSPFTILLIIVLVFSIPLHPINGGLLIILVFAVLYISILLYRRVSLKSEGPVNGIPRAMGRNVGILIMLIASLWYVWYIQFQFFGNFIKGLAEIPNWMGSQAALMQGWAEKAQLTLADIGAIFLKLHGHNLLYLALAGVAIIYLVKKCKSRSPVESGLIFLMAVLMILFSILTIVAFFSAIRIEYWRVIPYALMPAMILAGWFLDSTKSLRLKRFAFGGALTIVMAGFLIGTFNTYPSPWIESDNTQITHSAIKGVNWFSYHQDDTLTVDPVVMSLDRVWGSVRGYTPMPPTIHQTLGAAPLPHFGYDNYSSYGGAYTEDHYVTLPAMAYGHYIKRIPNHPSIWLWTLADLEHLHNDPSLSLIYSNSGFEIFYAKGLAGEKGS